MIGIDPGVRAGAIAHVALTASGAPVVRKVWDMPTEFGANKIDRAGLWGIFLALQCRQFVIEKQTPFAKAASKTSFAHGEGYGVLQGLLFALKEHARVEGGESVVEHYVDPKDWKRQLQIPSAKDRAGRKSKSRTKAAQIFTPEDCERWPNAGHDGRWEAALLRYWGERFCR